MTQDTGKTATRTSTSKFLKDSKESTEVKLIQRGKYYLTPYNNNHLEEVANVLSVENIEELSFLGYQDTKDALVDLPHIAEAYVVREEGGAIIFIGGLLFEDDNQWPQMFAMFSNTIKKNFHVLARGSKMLVNFFDKTQAGMCMTILSKHSDMVQWATWLGFEVVGKTEFNGNTYIDFVRCNPNQKDVYDTASQPVMH